MSSDSRDRRRYDDREGRDARRGRDDGANRRGERSESPRRRRSPIAPFRRGGPLPSQTDSFALTDRPKDPVRRRGGFGGEGRGGGRGGFGGSERGERGGEGGEEKEKEKPNYYPTGILAASSNQVSLADGTNITLKYHEPPEARLPPSRDDWKLFVFKDKEVLDTVSLSARSCWLVGREARVVDLAAEHPSVSGQHAAVQFRYVERRDEFGERKGAVKPYVIDLEAKAGTVVNGDRIPAGRYVEVRNGDVVRFGESTREYVLMLDRK